MKTAYIICFLHPCCPVKVTRSGLPRLEGGGKLTGLLSRIFAKGRRLEAKKSWENWSEAAAKSARKEPEKDDKTPAFSKVEAYSYIILKLLNKFWKIKGLRYLKLYSLNKQVLTFDLISFGHFKQIVSTALTYFNSILCKKAHLFWYLKLVVFSCLEHTTSHGKEF